VARLSDIRVKRYFCKGGAKELKLEKEVVVRPVIAEDAADICELCCMDLGYQCDKFLVSERISQLEADKEAVFVAVLDEKVVGFIHIEKYTILYFEAMTNILGLAVNSKLRKKGIGRALLERAEKWAVEKDISLVRLNSGITRAGAHKFYRRLGYGMEKEQIRFMKRLEGIDGNE